METAIILYQWSSELVGGSQFRVVEVCGPEELKGMLKENFEHRAMLNRATEEYCQRAKVHSYLLISVDEYNGLLEDAHHVDDFKKRLLTKAKPLVEMPFSKGAQTSEAVIEPVAEKKSSFFNLRFL
jgi:hypothetical protein